MVYLILGPSGSGKTRYLIEEANREKANGNGNIVFVDTDDSHIFTLDYSVRLINAAKYNLECIGQFYGFIAGIASRDYDIEKIYLDGIYEILDLKDENLLKLVNKLDWLAKEYNIEIFMGLNREEGELPEGIKAEVKVLS